MPRTNEPNQRIYCKSPNNKTTRCTFPSLIPVRFVGDQLLVPLHHQLFRPPVPAGTAPMLSIDLLSRVLSADNSTWQQPPQPGTTVPTSTRITTHEPPTDHRRQVVPRWSPPTEKRRADQRTSCHTSRHSTLVPILTLVFPPYSPPRSYHRNQKMSAELAPVSGAPVSAAHAVVEVVTTGSGDHRTSPMAGATKLQNEEVMRIVYNAEIKDLPCMQKCCLRWGTCRKYDVERSYLFVRENSIEMNVGKR